MPKLTTEIPSDLSRQIDRIIRDGWFPDQESVVREALSQFVDAKSFLGDSPRMLHRFAADALNDSKPEVALKFVSRALSLMVGQDITDFTLYQSLVELAYWGGLSQSEIAEYLSIPLGTVKTRTRSALRRLADELEDELG